MIEKASGGRLDIELFGAGEVVPSWELLGAVSEGVADASMIWGSYHSGEFPGALYDSEVPPYTLESNAQFLAFYQNYGIEELLRQGFADRYNIHYVINASYAMPSLILTAEPITGIDDFEGRIIRAYGLMADIIGLAGGEAVFITYEEVYTSLEKGVIDGVSSTDWYYFLDTGWAEVQKYLLVTPYQYSGAEGFVVNSDSWEALPEDLQALIYVSWPIQAQWMEGFLAYQDALARKEMLDNLGVIETTIPPEDVEVLRGYSFQAAATLGEKGPVYAEATNRLKEFMKLLGLLD